jgi:hypothetical protein
MLVLVAITSVVFIVLAAVLLRARRTSSGCGLLPVDASWIEELSVERYRPMARLLDERDFEFLRKQPGFSSRLASRLRAQRCQIFNGYLKCLEMDFRRVCLAAKLLLLRSREDRPDLAATIFRTQASFALCLFLVRVRVLLYRLGFCRVDASALIRVFDSMQVELRTLVPATEGALA